MKRSGSWFALILIASALLLSDACSFAQNGSPSIGDSQNQKAANQQTQTQEPPSQTGINVSITASPAQPARSTQRGNTADNSQGWNHWFWQNLTGILLVLVGIWAACIAISTLGLIAEQTQAGTVAANAAKESADTAKKTLNDLERPWVFIRIVSMEGFERMWPVDTQIMQVRLRWYLQNFGRSPAFIFDGAIQFKTISLPIPERPDYGNAAPPALIPLPQGIPQRNRTFPVMLTREQHQSLMRNDIRLMFFGFVRYRDTFNTEHVSRWCATLTVPALWIMGEPPGWWTFEGPPAYTQCT